MSIISVYLIAMSVGMITANMYHNLSTGETILGIIAGIIGMIGLGIYEISTHNKITDLGCDIETLKEMIEIDKQRKVDRATNRKKR